MLTQTVAEQIQMVRSAPLLELCGKVAHVRGLAGAWRWDRTGRGPVRVVAPRWPLVLALCAMDGWNRRGRRARLNTVGVVESGHLTEPVLLDVLTKIPHGVTELVCHPGYLSEELLLDFGAPGYERDKELAALTSSVVREHLEAQGIVLTTFREVLGQADGASKAQPTDHGGQPSLPEPVHRLRGGWAGSVQR